MQSEYEIQLQIPVQYKDMPGDMAFAGTPPHAITVRIRDRGSVLLNYTLGQKKASIAVNIQDTTLLHGRNVLLLSAKDIEGMIMKQLIPTTSLLSFDPQQIEMPYSKLKNKRLPVHFSGDIRTAPGFLVSGEVVVSPSMTDVYAADAVLASMTSVETVYTEIHNANKAIDRRLKLKEVPGAVFEPGVVSVTIHVEEYTQKTLEIPVVCTSVAEGYTIRMFPSTVKVTCNVPLSLFKELSDKDFAVEVIAADAERSASGMLHVRLLKKPDGVDRVTISPDSIEFILEQGK
jgi:hypothetical protein